VKQYIKKNNAANLFFLLPFLVVILIFILIPVGQIFYNSLFIRRLNGSIKFVGLENFISIFSDTVFLRSARNTFVWVTGTVFFKNFLGLLLGLIMAQKFIGNKGFQVTALLPWATPWIISSILFKWFFDGVYGYLNSFLFTLGFISKPIDFLGNPRFALWGVIIANVWTAIPFCGFVYLAVLNSIPKHLYEAAHIDGAYTLQLFRHITWPHLLPTIQLVLILTSIWGINSFDMIFTMTDGGPSGASETFVTYIYRLAFRMQASGKAYALSVVVFLILIALVIFYIRYGKKNEEHA
jgi:multiple sugar transport system permease protein